VILGEVLIDCNGFTVFFLSDVLGVLEVFCFGDAGTFLVTSFFATGFFSGLSFFIIFLRNSNIF